jgi:hypothetical protein
MVWFKLLAVGGASQADGDHNRDHVVTKTYFAQVKPQNLSQTATSSFTTKPLGAYTVSAEY